MQTGWLNVMRMDGKRREISDENYVLNCVPSWTLKTWWHIYNKLPKDNLTEECKNKFCTEVKQVAKDRQCFRQYSVTFQWTTRHRQNRCTVAR